MSETKFRNFLKRLTVPESDQQRREDARMEMKRNFRTYCGKLNLECPASERFSFGFRITSLAGAFACLLLFALYFFKLSIPPDSIALQIQYIREIDTLFQNELQAVVFSAEGKELKLASEPTLHHPYPVIVDLRRNKQTVRIVAIANGRLTVRLGQHDIPLEIYVTGSGNVIVAGPDFLHEGNNNLNLHGFSVSTQLYRNKLGAAL